MMRSHEHSISIRSQNENRDVGGEENTSHVDPNAIASTLMSNGNVAPVYKKLVEKLEDDEAKSQKQGDEDCHDHQELSMVKPKIQRVPAILRTNKHFEMYYEPRWISIGPIHHDKPQLQHQTQYKLVLAAKFIQSSGSGTEVLYSKIKKKFEELKKCFHEDFVKDYDDDTLCWILFFDGCTALQLINSYVNNNNDELRILKIKTDQIALAQQDLFLLENQIPFSILKVLMESCGEKKCEELKVSVKEFIRYNVMAPYKYKKSLQIEIDNPEPVHLLELLRSVILQQPEQNRSSCGCPGFRRTKLDLANDSDQGQQSFRSVQDLRAAGIDLRPSETCSLRDITFTSLCFAGWLRLPPMTVDDTTGPKLLNLIAYEMCPDNINTDYEVTSYVSFLDSLVDYPSDVKDLRSSRILYNLLGCDKDVAQLFNGIATDLVASPVYMNVISQIQNHYKSKWRTWMAQVYHDHFSSPWTIVAFLAAVVALGMSGIQTWTALKDNPSQPSSPSPS
ncbi:UPF0481 protein At3g47200-like [Humulus lupulus]|uniref:UPF0481 protein At3g47200-like n=1 Tax=Humulus lupulus TaxID=3486 RepID=UPI002B405434|nr:UPF0481 protein At3g47200-like [Humulus lupulus]